MKQKNLKQLSEKEFLERLEKSRKQSKDGKGKERCRYCNKRNSKEIQFVIMIKGKLMLSLFCYSNLRK